VNAWFNEYKKFPDQQVVILSQVLVHQTTQGYEDYTNLRVYEVNDQPVRNLKHLTQIVDDAIRNPPAHGCLKFKLRNNRLLIIDIVEAIAATPIILDQHRVPSQMSSDLRA
jgi:hypothetical protein